MKNWDKPGIIGSVIRHLAGEFHPRVKRLEAEVVELRAKLAETETKRMRTTEQLHRHSEHLSNIEGKLQKLMR